MIYEYYGNKAFFGNTTRTYSNTVGNLDFSNPDNSGLLALFLGHMGVLTLGVLDFSDPENSGLLALVV